MKICPSCGERLSDEAKFCPVDGTALAAATPGAPEDPPAGSQFAKTLFGAPAPGTAPQGAPPAASYDDLPASTSVDVVSSTKGSDVDVQVTPSKAPAPKAAKKKESSREVKPPSDLLPRPKARIALAVVAALSGASIVGILAVAVRLARSPAGEPAAIIAGAEDATSPVPIPPPAPTLSAVPEDPSGHPVAGADVAAPPHDGTVSSSPAETESGAPDAGKAEEPSPPEEPEEGRKKVVARTTERTKKKLVVPTPSPATKVDPKQAEIYVRAGEEHLKRGSHAKAEAAFEQARAYDPTNAAALAGLGEVAFEQGDYAEAISKLRAAVRLDRNSRYLTLLGNAYFKGRKYRQAIEQYKRALKLSPSNTEAAEGLKAAQTKLRGG